ncbi:hypothetical protein ACFLR5_01840, partial [Elusimicrobiota bacterium]
MKRKRVLFLAVLSTLVVICQCPLKAAEKRIMQGLSTKFADIILSGLKPGMVYSFIKSQKLPYKVINKSPSPADIEIIIEIPRENHMKEGYEPIPDPSWIKATPADFRLQPNEASSCDLIISVPEGEEYANRH